MKNVYKQLFRKIRYTKIFLKTLIVFTLISFISLGLIFIQMDENTLEEFLNTGILNSCTMFSTIVIIVFIGITLGKEFNNKTIYYWIMNGYSRAEVFFGKLIGILPYIIVLSLIQSGILYGIFSFMTDNEFLDKCLNHFILNSFTFLIIYISYAILTLSCSFISKSIIGGIGLGYMIMIGFNIINFLLDLSEIKIFSFKLSNLFGMSLSGYLLASNDDITFQSVVIITYILLSVCYLLIGYNIFKKADLT